MPGSDTTSPGAGTWWERLGAKLPMVFLKILMYPEGFTFGCKKERSLLGSLTVYKLADSGAVQPGGCVAINSPGSKPQSAPSALCTYNAFDLRERP